MTVSTEARTYFRWTTSPYNDAIGKTHLFNGDAKVDVRIADRPGLHLEVFIKSKQNVFCIMVDDQNVVDIEQHVCVIFKAVERTYFCLHP